MNIVPYEKTEWFDEIFDPVTGEILEEGTPYLAAYANNFEEGIEDNRNYIVELKSQIQRLQIQLEIDGRAPGSSGTFFDTLDGFSNKIFLQNQQASIITAIAAGATTISVDSSEGLTAFTQVTIYDDEHSEDVLITAMNGNSITVQAVANAYKKGAKVARSNVAVDTVNKKMDIGNWETFSVSVVEVV